MLIGMESALGIRMKIERSEPPASSAQTLAPASASRNATADPADPVPTMM